MHTRHEALFQWLMQRFPDTRLYGPYNHGGRSYYQWMARGTALVQGHPPAARAGADRRARRTRGGATRRRCVSATRRSSPASGTGLPAERDVGALAARYGLPAPAPRAARGAARPADGRSAGANDDRRCPCARRPPGRFARRSRARAGPGCDYDRRPRIGRRAARSPVGDRAPGGGHAPRRELERKCEFLDRAVRTCELGNVDVVHARIEEWAASMDLVTARALAPLEVVVEYAAPLLRIGGTLVVWRGQREPESEAAAEKAAEIVGIEVGEILAVRPYPAARNRHLHLMSKVMETPTRFPRRPGIAMKRPLGSGKP